MEVIESVNEGLKRELRVVVPAGELESRLSGRLDELKGQIRLDGFRPGKVPVKHLRRRFGRSVMAEVLRDAVTESSMKAIDDRSEKPAFQPEITFGEGDHEIENEIEKVLTGGADLAFTLSFEVIPPIEVVDLSTIKLERLKSEPTEKEIGEAVERIASSQRDFKEKEGRSEQGDRVTIDFVGRIDGKTFDGGSAEDEALELGSNLFIPGFEDQLVGKAAGDEVEVRVTFPDDYGAEDLAGRDAVFDVTVKEVAVPIEMAIDDDLAISLGMENLEKLREAVSGQIAEEYDRVSKARLKRTLLDELDDMHKFELPEKLVDQEFEEMWRALAKEMETAKETFEDEDLTEEDARKEYRGLAERRVRLGLLLGAIGETGEITISEDEMRGAVAEQVRRFPGQEKEVFDYYKENPDALAAIRAPVFEQKVIDFIAELADVSERLVDREELYRDPDEDEADEQAARQDTEQSGTNREAVRK